MSGPFWVSAFLDLAPDGFDEGIAFWAGVTGYALSERRGADDEFATLVPPDGDDYLRVQRLGDGPGRLHLDVHVEDPTAEADRAVGLGARVQHRSEHGYVVLQSPGGLTFCLVSHPAATRPAPAAWPGGRSAVDQVCLDIPAGTYDAEVAFWQGLTGWRHQALDDVDFDRLVPPDAQPLRWLLQRLHDPDGAVSAHLDLACDDRAAETARHVGLGATVVRVHDEWTVLTDPLGTAYCITGRPPR